MAIEFFTWGDVLASTATSALVRCSSTASSFVAIISNIIMATTISPLYALHIAVVAVAFVDTVVAVVENRLQLNLVMQADAEKLPVMVAVVTVRMVAEGELGELCINILQNAASLLP
ncbi:hypothetical protein AK812_SmicGene33387 [Symbiodinium microadriaticum]|uniref:Uncharacterized protein n=1 Tax=Symbiodinium microadriaticum TaxID=2951 RepID=A0A1Q9CRQ9_SYMMI|nr:hypothetical protein AK812_SmicGene33387 [Symbiodinium microadriaticum]